MRSPLELMFIRSLHDKGRITEDEFNELVKPDPDELEVTKRQSN